MYNIKDYCEFKHVIFVGKRLRVIIIKATIMKIVPTVAIDFGTKDNSKKKNQNYFNPTGFYMFPA